jgi:ferredoxin
MKVSVDKSVCVLTGNCALTADRVFRIEGDELEYEPSPDDVEHEVVQEAADTCPVQAITVDA